MFVDNCTFAKEAKTMTEKEYKNRLEKIESSIAVNRQKAIVAEQKQKVTLKVANVTISQD